MPNPQISPEERLVKFLKLNEVTHCWEWTGWKNNRGYGQIGLDGKLVYAHRLAWLLWIGDIPTKLCVLHKCDNPVCCNPKHLFLGTIADNNADCLAKGRHISGFTITRPKPHPNPGEANGSHKLTNDNVIEILRTFEAGNITKAELARRFKVCDTTIFKIVKRRQWRHITDLIGI